MTTKTIAGVNIEFSDEGYLLDMQAWNREVAMELAKEEGLELTDKHFEVLEFIRGKAAKGETLTIRSVGKSGLTDIKGFYKLFPGAPLKKASRLAGIAKPSSCV